MIQRIQTIFLLIAFAFGLSMFFTSQIEYTAETIYALSFKGINAIDASESTKSIPTIALSILLFLTPAVSFISIFLFKNRMVQIRLCAANIGLLIGTTGLIYYFGSVGLKELNAQSLSYSVTMVFPIAGAILNFLALRAIGKDEALIKSMDRIR
ncbi:DUF4293 domain-containing protein [Plebeiibacterium marinum]|uniref:DUF4293 domain-containing protein n=1 Tax=Plebeiibacterium marinum TaxID=2992111 RepID=A0AAE3MC28_9BACT|nr:DUF4293 domain-containing protein [Plebeiobacterium marinum]MCW3804706.1 DUF4293 domain-containing protein [Plebeiobacterium marinum]